MKKAFTLMELLIVVGLLITIAIVALVTLNPWGQINKSQDSKRKQELTQLGKVFEDYYNDKSCYPRPQDVCYPSTESGYNPSTNTKCYICGDISGSPQITAYLSRLPCDPKHPNKKYLYQTDNNTCPSWYRIYSTLSSQSDPVIAEVGCSSGCGISPDFDYDYGVTSPNIGLEFSLTSCLTSENCTSYCSSIGKTCNPDESFSTYIDSSCQNYLGVCTGPSCCGDNPVGGQVQSYKCFCQ